MSTSASILKLQAIEARGRFWFSGIILSGSPGSLISAKTAFMNLRKTVSSYFLRPEGFVNLVIDTGKKEVHTSTDIKGNFYFDIDSDDLDQDALTILFNDLPLAVVQEYPLFFEDKKSRFLIITDLDDTILVSNIKKPLKRLKNLLWKPPHKRKVVDETLHAFEMLNSNEFDYFYVSRSESNLFPMISSFITNNDLPLGPLFLRSYTHWHQLLRRGREKGFKETWINWIAERFPDEQLIFFGDDSQHDYQVFTNFAGVFPERVRAIFIRRTTFRPKKVEKKNDQDNVYFYSEISEIENELTQIQNEATVRS